MGPGEFTTRDDRGNGDGNGPGGNGENGERTGNGGQDGNNNGRGGGNGDGGGNGNGGGNGDGENGDGDDNEDEELQTLTIGIDKEGSGNVTSNPEGIDCPEECAYDFPADEQATLTAAAEESDGWFFYEFTGCDEAEGAECRMTMDVPRRVIARFELKPKR